MTTLHRPAAPTAYGSARLLAGATHGVRADLAAHRAVHGAQQHRTRATLVEETGAVRLLGRGGAAFPVSTKLAGMPTGSSVEVVVNGSESEPASRKDRTLMTLVPHLVVDGALVVARALRTRRVTIAVHDTAAHASLTLALEERRGSEPHPERVSVRLQPARFVSGEVRAVLRGLDGRPAVPPGHRVLPTRHGLGGAPTFASNVETFAQIAVLVSLGARRYAEVGDRAEPGTTLVTLLGDVPAPGVAEVPTGLPLDALLPAAGGPVLVGGYHGHWVADARGLRVTRPSLREAGVPLNAGVVARLPESGCALAEVAAVAGWLARQSAGQCGPCLFGTAAVARDVSTLLYGRPAPDVSARLHGLVRRGACAHPDGTAAFVASALTTMTAELDAHVDRGGCGRPYLAVLPLDDGVR
ncbi:NADH-ubiquinone oxidoreductase-F iron-sulfur binding region domain-containing protein [Nocardioides sp. URHA0032]|uniref:NADH-ubiquinone oxidoreductase-F iron-sulfur binding region domain-containing protein n=1 Tax=Nocardioides sp. URHA0032 TaxID=1380388 RepID=UPI00048A5C78|nr:NADH-ubiquinone oxidoreductase-F iron-sulfur binding region domain-containing protein [Nocardioides sp. URHA0032]